MHTLAGRPSTAFSQRELSLSVTIFSSSSSLLCLLSSTPLLSSAALLLSLPLVSSPCFFSFLLLVSSSHLPFHNCSCLLFFWLSPAFFPHYLLSSLLLVYSPRLLFFPLFSSPLHFLCFFFLSFFLHVSCPLFSSPFSSPFLVTSPFLSSPPLVAPSKD